jgi:hypothetical protein
VVKLTHINLHTQIINFSNSHYFIQIYKTFFLIALNHLSGIMPFFATS